MPRIILLVLLRILEYIPQIYSPLVPPSGKYGQTNCNHNHCVKVGVDGNVGAVLWKKPERHQRNWSFQFVEVPVKVLLLIDQCGNTSDPSYPNLQQTAVTSLVVMLNCLVAGELNI